MTKKGCLMAKMPQNLIDDFKHLIDLNDLSEVADSSDAHVTILYGIDLEKNTLEEVKSFIKQHIKPFNVLVGKMDVFENEEYDVLIFKCASPELVYLNHLVKTNLVCEESKFPNYIPHLTIAYLKKGCARKYIQEHKPITVKVNKVNYSYHLDEETKKTLTIKL